MKRLQLNKVAKFYRSGLLLSRKIFVPMCTFLLFSGFTATAQPPELPVLTVRFANPVFDCPTKTYCLDVEFQANTAGLKLFGMNVRFFYDGNILEYLSMGDFAQGYDILSSDIYTYPAGSGNVFGIAGPLKWFDGTVQLTDTTSVYLSTTGWTKLFNICFRVKDPTALQGVDNFCPSIVWDLQSDPSLGGYFSGDDGVVMTIVDPSGQQDSQVTTENVVQFNWEYVAGANIFGHPVDLICVSTWCGYLIPLANWSLFLAIGLMIIATLFIWKRRLNS